MTKGSSKKQNTWVAWEGDSLEVLRSFPGPIREELGADLRRLQEGSKPLHSRPMKSIAKRVFELKQQDGRGWYRLIYFAKIREVIYVLHCFRKKSRQTARKDLAVATERLKNIQARRREEKKNEHKK